ncbi:Alpha-ketoglutarate-dependent dioxygenase alkB 4 [Dermatophagoides pteronyssinus]|uniref:Alpha-ketoglutarate-dependent dioxygenase alkB 4 n=1 Tax=Dermatophagoides pteronyssinus TaxID=6956 RepID=A0ABQ8J9E9_DERPT|nr:Alpha-ketoglutarate-dependent dioxygenase alkB 4 [Dermatophagoides pteronyssinus]
MPDKNTMTTDIKSRSCACKGIRTCLQCENYQLPKSSGQNLWNTKTYVYCWRCGNRAYASTFFDKHVEDHEKNNEFDDVPMIQIDGVFLQTDVITDDEEVHLIKQIDSFDWVDSQSGRRKQDFGPKINFKKQKINFTPFTGLPKLDVEILNLIRRERLTSHNDWHRFSSLPFDQYSDHTILNRFYPIEICHLEYCPERGSSIDPHFDDNWIWGDRLVTLNLASTAVITLTFPELSSVPEYCIRIACPKKSLLVLYGDARYKFHHSIHRSDINHRRLAITFRELAYSFFQQSYLNKDKRYLLIHDEFINRSKKMITK